MSSTEGRTIRTLMEKAIRTLQKDNARLREALADAQELNAGLEQDKDNAHMLVQLILNQMRGRMVFISDKEMREFSPHRWYVERTYNEQIYGVTYTLKDK